MWENAGVIGSLVISLLALAGTFYAVKIKVAVMENEITNIKEENKTLHNRIDASKKEAVTKTEKLAEEVSEIKADMATLKVQMAENKTEIIAEIHKLKK